MDREIKNALSRYVFSLALSQAEVQYQTYIAGGHHKEIALMELAEALVHSLGGDEKVLDMFPDTTESAMVWAERAIWRARQEESKRRRAEKELYPWRFRRPISKSKRRRIMERDGNQCKGCGASERLVIDHIVPVRHGGTDDESNLQTLCSPCNSRKGTRVQ